MGARTRAHRAHALLLVAVVVLGGCASFALPPLAADDPANPDAPAAPERPRSTTLAYARSDVPSAAPLPMAAAVERAGSPSAGGPAARTVVGEGEVIATVPNASQIVVEHGEIKGFMEPMTMGYRIDPPALLERVKPGDSVRFTIDVDRRAIIAIETLR
jgi:Cu/Ag efflux protein CusF